MTEALTPLFKRRPDAVLLDLDDTLYAYAPAHAAGSAAVRDHCTNRLGIEPGAFKAEFDKARAAVKSRLDGTAAAHHRLLYFQQLIETATGKSDADLTLELEKTYWRRFMATARLFPGVRDTLDELRFAKIPTALVTDLTAQIQMRKLVYFELEHAFDAVVTSEEVGAEKPAPAIFKRALEKLGLDAKAHVWMIGENPDKDIRGARDALGALTVQKIHHGVSRTTDADAHIEEFFPLAVAIRQNFARAS